MRVIVEQLVEWRLAGETEVLGENPPQRHFVPPQIPHDQVRFRTPDRSGGKPVTNRLSYGAAPAPIFTLLLHLHVIPSFVVVTLKFCEHFISLPYVQYVPSISSVIWNKC
jgi:hypothetical protein